MPTFAPSTGGPVLETPRAATGLVPAFKALGAASLVCVATLTPLAGCSKKNESGDEQKAQALAEKPAPKPANKTEIDVNALPTSAADREAAIWMPIGDRLRKIGAHRIKQTVALTIKGPVNTVEMGETNTLEHTSKLDFHLTSEDKDGKGIEAFFIEGVIYAGNKGGPFVNRGRDLMLARRRREAAYRPLQQLLEPYKSGLTLVAAGRQMYEGRSLAVFRVGLDPAKTPAAPAPNALSREEAASAATQAANEYKADLSTKPGSRNQYPIKLGGTMAFDATTGVLIKAEIDGVIRSGTQKLNADITWSVNSEIFTIGEPTVLDVPPVTTPERAAQHENDPTAFYTGKAKDKAKAIPTGDAKGAGKDAAKATEKADAKKPTDKATAKPADKKTP